MSFAMFLNNDMALSGFTLQRLSAVISCCGYLCLVHAQMVMMPDISSRYIALMWCVAVDIVFMSFSLGCFVRKLSFRYANVIKLICLDVKMMFNVWFLQ